MENNVRSNDVDQSLHEKIYPIDVRPGDKITVELKRLDGEKIEEVLTVWRLSPLGIEFASSNDLTQKFKVGTRMDVVVRYPQLSVEHFGLVVRSVSEEKGKTLIGVRWVSVPDFENSKTYEGERRTDKRWICGEEYLPNGIFANPVKFNDFIYFRVRDLSKNGMLIETSLRNKLITPGMRISNVILNFPVIGRATVGFEIISARIHRRNGSEVLVIGCEFIRPNMKLREYIGQYLLQFGPTTTLAEIEKAGLTIGSINNAVTFTFVKSEEDYKNVLELRRRAWIATKKFKEDAKPEDFADEIDARSRILVAYFRGMAIASLRLVFSEPGQKLEHEKYLELPSSLPRRDEIVESTRVVVDPEFRGKDLLYLLLRHACIVVLQSGKRYLLGNSDVKLLPLYQKLGFQIVSDLFEVKGMQVHAKMFIGDVHAMIAGKGVNPIVWNLLFTDLVQYLVDVDLVKMTTNDRLRILGFKTLAPVSKIIGQRMANKPRKRKK